MEKLYYSVNEVAEMVGVEPSTIRFWEREIPRFSSKHVSRKRCVYTSEMVELAKQIAYLRYDKKLSLDGVRMQLSAQQTDMERDQQVVERLRALKAQLLDIKAEL